MIDELDRPHWMKTARDHDAAYRSHAEMMRRGRQRRAIREIATALVVVAVLLFLFVCFV